MKTVKPRRKKKLKKRLVLNLRKERLKKKRLRRAITALDYLNSGEEPMPTVNKNSPVETLTTAYPIGLYWSNEEDSHLFELSAFAIEAHAVLDWAQSMAIAQATQRLLINSYRNLGRALPEVG
jgi:hypothetical protein